MKPSSEFLWQLIKSLKSAEKTYFKRNFTNTKSGTSRLYLQLFDAIASQKKYDEAAILKKFHPALTKKNIAFQKHYLQKQIFDAIIQYDGKKSISQELYNQVLLIKVLRKKGLIDFANTLWKKAIIKARAAEQYPILTMLVNEFQKMILSGNSETRYDELHAIFKGRTLTYSDYAEMNSLRDIYTELLLLKRKAHFDIDRTLLKRLTILKELIDNIDYKKQTKTFWFSHYYQLSKATLFYLLGEINSTMPLLTEALDDWKKYKQHITKDGEFYIELLYMINYAGVLHGSYDFVIKTFNDPVNDLIIDPVQRGNFEAIKFTAINKIYNKTAQYDEVIKLVQSMKTKYRQWEPFINDDLNRTVNFSLGIACFVLEKFDDALYFIKRGNSDFNDGSREEYTAIAHILLLLITYNMDNDRLFEAEYRVTYTYFHKRKKKHPFETALVQCLKHNFYLPDKKSRIIQYQKTLRVFENNKEDMVQQLNINIFNYPGWLMSKVQNIPYRKYVENKVKEEKLLVTTN